LSDTISDRAELRAEIIAATRLPASHALELARDEVEHLRRHHGLEPLQVALDLVRIDRDAVDRDDGGERRHGRDDREHRGAGGEHRHLAKQRLARGAQPSREHRVTGVQPVQ
jgi:hypothetical protein